MNQLIEFRGNQNGQLSPLVLKINVLQPETILQPPRSSPWACTSSQLSCGGAGPVRPLGAALRLPGPSCLGPLALVSYPCSRVTGAAGCHRGPMSPHTFLTIQGRHPRALEGVLNPVYTF